MNRASLTLSQSRRENVTALPAPEAEACRDIGLAVGLSSEVLLVVKTDSHDTLTQLRNECILHLSSSI